MKQFAAVALLALVVPGAFAVQDSDGPLEKLERDLSSEDPDVRIAAQQDLFGGVYKKADPAALVSVLVRRIRAPIPESWEGPAFPRKETTFRGLLIEHLAWHYKSEAGTLVPALLDTLADGSNATYLRGAAASALGSIGSGKPEVVSALIDAIEDPWPQSTGVHDRAARALGGMGAGAMSAVPALTRLLAHRFGMVQDAAFEALGRIAADGSTLTVADHLDRVRRVHELDAGEASATLLALTAAPEEAREAVPALVELLEARGDDYFQRAALQLLTAVGPRATPRLVAALLEAMIKDRSREAEATLLAIEPDGPAPVHALAEALRALLAGEHSYVFSPQRVVVARALARFGRDGGAATPVLLDGLVREAPRLELHMALRQEFETYASALAAVGEGDASAAEAVLRAMDEIEDGAFAAWGRAQLLEAFAGIGLPADESNRADLLGRIRAALETSDANAKRAAASIVLARADELEDAEAAPLVPLFTSALEVELAASTIPALGALGARAALALPALEAIAGEELLSLFTNHRERERKRMASEAIAVIRAALAR